MPVPPDSRVGDPPSPPSAAAPAAPFGDLAGPVEPWWQRLRALPATTGWSADRPVMRLVAVAVVAAVVGAGAVWLAGDGGRAPGAAAGGLPMATRPPGSPAPASRPPGSGAAAVAETTVAGGWVALAGAVARPGLYRVQADTRLSALLAAGGGMTPDADADRVNLAAPVRDGERVYVPRRGEAGAPAVVAGSTGGGGAPGVAGPGSNAPRGPVDLNRATVEELDALPGVGPATATAIITHRTTNGGFRSVDDLAAVRGIGPAKLEQLRPLVTV